MNDLSKIRIESVLYVVTLVAAAFLRFYDLGGIPLSDLEAISGLQSFQIISQLSTTISGVSNLSPIYNTLTAAIFTIAGQSIFSARFWPAVAGVLLVIFPVMIKNRIGQWTALMMALGIAFNPVLVTISRQTGGAMLAICFSFLSAGFLFRRSIIPAGIFFGLFLSSGEYAITGLFAFLTTYLAIRYLFPKEFESGEVHRENKLDNQSFTREAGTFVASTIITTLLVGTAFMQHPSGISDVFLAISDYFSSFFARNGISILSGLVGIIFYQPFLILMVISSLVILIFDGFDRSEKLLIVGPSIFILVILVINLLNSGRTMADLGWITVPMLLMAACSIVFIAKRIEFNVVTWILAGFLFLVAILFWNALIIPQTNISISVNFNIDLSLLMIAGLILMSVLAILLVGMGWSWSSSLGALFLAIFVSSLILSISITWNSAYRKANQPVELWHALPGTGQQLLLGTTIENLSNSTEGSPDAIDGYSTVESSSLHWLMLDFPNLGYKPQIVQDALPSVIITTSSEESPLLNTSYRGQDFSWWSYPGWINAIPDPFLSWFTSRNAPVLREYIVLWVRSDLFPGTEFDQEEFDYEEYEFEEFQY